MCGIAGFIGKGDFDDIARMTRNLKHRGPDEEGFWKNDIKHIFFGHRRLSVIDPVDGKQPMWDNTSSLCIIFNGEIYNYIELRKELESLGYVFQTSHSDTEVLLIAYKEWGEHLVSRLNGMWAFAIYDVKKEEIFISRDRVGEKPLFYTFQNGTFAFASELKSLIQHENISTSISKLSLQKYFAYGFIPAPRSLYENIFKLPGGYNLFVNVKSLDFKICKYWGFCIEPVDKVPKNAESVWGEELRDLLNKAVQCRMRSDVPLGVFLSGGVDSSAITYFSAKNACKNRVQTFSIGFTEKSFDESKHSNYAANIFNTIHHNRVFSLTNIQKILNEIVTALDEPIGDSSLLPSYLLCHETKKHVTVALGGDGADELFAGYDPFRALHLAEFYNTYVPGKIHTALRFFVDKFPVSHNNMSIDYKIKRTLRGLSYQKRVWNAVWLSSLEPKEIAELLSEHVDLECLYEEAIYEWDTCGQSNLIDKTLQFYTNLYLQNNILAKIDRASMLNSLEVRSPFLDIRIIDFFRKVPYQYKYRNGQTKYILIKALEPILPKSILHRAKKGFGIPVGKWFQQNKLRLPCNRVNMDFKMNESFLEKITHDHLHGKADQRLFLWNLWLLLNGNFASAQIIR